MNSGGVYFTPFRKLRVGLVAKQLCQEVSYRIVAKHIRLCFSQSDVMRNIQKDLTYPKRADNLRITHQFVARLARGFARVHAP